ncbi:prefoldin beta subunit [Fusarium oxysporum f. sp. lycopersici 4287]|uniref:Prefoldin beta subunit n=1 Tax=Fusarium oxysporum f. sp. lycopersici (strain 4287 / CBS 123668 / FGSC 9935 / NRRL 34936) TaxID=426428 RepID=A0A0J9VR71_FUSO4|nr:prefoldin beta subunit [Fusarium oxysporum f. sp. lycopersici 4287]KNB13403.1 prefoldin beta subunit [Fusarium oxysporum f. sp. lycopersici 4287]
MSDPQARLQALSEDFQKLQGGITLWVATEVGGSEAGECWRAAGIERLQEGETIYKLAGPVLLKQDKFEAENTVKGRLDFISGEITRLEDTIKETQEKLEKKKTEIIQIQTAAQSQGKEAPQ